MSVLVSFGQLNLTGSHSCNCDGVISYSWSGGETIFVELTDYTNQFVQSASGSSGLIQFQNLCPRVHSLHITGLNSGETTFLFTVEDLTSPLPAFSDEIVCYSEAGQDEIIELANIVGVAGSSFQWTVPGNYQAINGDVSVDDLNSGVVLYTDISSTCNRGSGMQIEFFNNSAGSETGSLLICESEVDSIELFSLLGGNPATTGYWTFQGQGFNGIFYPATMDGGFSNRYYYNVYVPECGITNVAPATVIERIPPNPGFSLNSENWYCENHNSVNMFELLGGNPERGGQWTFVSSGPNSMVSGIDSVFTPGQSPAGVYEYGLIPLLPCVGTYKSSLTISYYPDPLPGINVDTAVCRSSDTLYLAEIIQAPSEYPGLFTDDSGSEVSSIYIPAVESEVNLTYTINPFNCGARSSTIHIEPFQEITAGEDVILGICELDLPISITSLLSGTADAGGTWHLPGGSVFPGNITGNLTTLEVNYILGNLGCGNDTSHYQVNIDAPLSFTPTVTNIELCEGGEPVNLLNALGSSDLYFTNASGDTLPIVVFADSSQSSVIMANLSSGNVCPNIEFPITIQVQANVILDTISYHAFCESALPVQLSDLIDPGMSGLGEWIDEANNIVSIADPQVNDSALYTFQFFAQPLCGSQSLEVKVYAEPMIEVQNNTSTQLCLDDGVFNLGSLVEYDNSGLWYLNNLPVDNLSLSLSNAINEQFEYRILSDNSCPDAVSIHQFEVRNLPVVNAGEDVNVCLGDTIILGGQAEMGYSYQWAPTQFLISATSSNAAVIGLADDPLNAMSYTLTADDGICTNTDSVTVFFRNLPILQLDDSVQICYGASFTIEPVSDGVIHWQAAQGIEEIVSPTQTIIVNESQVLNLTATNSWGCSRNDSVLISVAFPPIFEVSAVPTASCSPLQVVERIDSCNMSDASFRWIIEGYDTLFGNLINSTIWNSGIFDLTIEAYSSEGCKSDTLLENLFEVYPNPVAEFDGYQDGASNLRQEVVFTNESESAISFEWSLNGLNASQMVHFSYDFEGNAPGNYQVCLLATSMEGCSDSICHDVHLIVEQVVFAPSAFTPNGDGTNDGFKPVINGFSPEVYEFIVFDKWGTVIFKSNNPDEYWMGEVNNGDYYSQNGVYNWMLTAKKFDNADVDIYRGSVMMIR